jgi:hypothetical protein
LVFFLKHVRKVINSNRDFWEGGHMEGNQIWIKEKKEVNQIRIKAKKEDKQIRISGKVCMT